MNSNRFATTGSIALALMAMSLSAGAASPKLANSFAASPAMDQTTDQERKADINEAKHDKAADKAQAKADKAEVKADKSHKVKKATKEQDKADAKIDKVNAQ